MKLPEFLEKYPQIKKSELAKAIFPTVKNPSQHLHLKLKNIQYQRIQENELEKISELFSKICADAKKLEL